MEKPTEQNTSERLERLSEVFNQHGVELTPEDLAQAKRAGFHVGYIRNAEGEIEYTEPLPHVDFVGDYEGWEYPDPKAERTKITPTKAKGKTLSGYEQSAILPDMQAGWERHHEGYESDLVPIHDEQAIETSLQIIKDHQPDHIIMNGDNLDFPELGSFSQEKRFEGLLQHSLNGVHELMSKIRANAPDAEIYWLEGNHEERLRREIGRNMMQLMGIRQPKSNEPILSVPHMLQLEELGIHYIDGYPANSHWINEQLKVVHGNTVNSSGSTAARIASRELVSVIFGHVHRREYATRRAEIAPGVGRTVVAASMGTLARIDGGVPSHGSGVNDIGNSMPRIENWTQGLGWVYHNSEEQHIVPIEINDHKAVFDGRVYGT